MPSLGPRLFAFFLLCGGCAHASAPSQTAPGDVDVQALRRDNASLRSKVASLEDRIVRLERETLPSGLPGDRDLPVVRLAPPSAARARSESEAESEPARSPDRSRTITSASGRKLGRRIGQMPGSGAPDEGYEDEPMLADGPPAPSSGKASSYRLVGDRLVELTKTRAPTRPDRPARDAAGNAILTEYETAMALYKGGEVAGAERAFELFARAHAKHDYADNALYWKGEAAYDQDRYDEALHAFTEVVERYGGGNKAPDALLKIGLCYGKLGDADNARDVLQGLVAAYPDAGASDIARTRLDELGS